MPTVRDWVIELAVMLSAAVALAALGPFGTFELGSFGARLGYWLPAAMLGYLIFRPIMLAATLIARKLSLPELPTLMVGVLVAAVPGSLAIAYLGGHQPVVEPQFDALFQLYVQVGLIGVLVTFLFTLLERRSPANDMQIAAPAAEVPSTPAPGEAPAQPAPFLDRLPPAWRDGLVALEMEDHYVRAHGPGTSALILLRMRDAEKELVGVEGYRVHRSWWVARAAVERVLRDGRSVKLLLKGGLEAPVARDRVAALKEAGLLDEP